MSVPMVARKHIFILIITHHPVLGATMTSAHGIKDYSTCTRRVNLVGLLTLGWKKVLGYPLTAWHAEMLAGSGEETKYA